MDELVLRMLACAVAKAKKMMTQNPPVTASDIGCDESTFLKVNTIITDNHYAKCTTYGPDGSLVTLTRYGLAHLKEHGMAYVEEYDKQ